MADLNRQLPFQLTFKIYHGGCPYEFAHKFKVANIDIKWYISQHIEVSMWLNAAHYITKPELRFPFITPGRLENLVSKVRNRAPPVQAATRLRCRVRNHEFLEQQASYTYAPAMIFP